MHDSLKMTIDIRFNRELTKDDYIVPGGYEMIFSGRNVQFDFQDYCGTFDSNNPTILHCELEHPDFDTFEDFRTISKEDIRKITEIIECYIYIGEECNPPLSAIEVPGITFLLDNGDMVEINETVIQNYNLTLMKGRN